MNKSTAARRHRDLVNHLENDCSIMSTNRFSRFLQRVARKSPIDRTSVSQLYRLFRSTVKITVRPLRNPTSKTFHSPHFDVFTIPIISHWRYTALAKVRAVRLHNFTSIFHTALQESISSGCWAKAAPPKLSKRTHSSLQFEKGFIRSGASPVFVR